MVMDNELSDGVLSKIWNSFFHFFLDEASYSFLIAQCRTLLEVSESITAWNDSKHSKFLRMCNVNTLLELRRHWKLYVQASQLSSVGKKRLKEMVLSGIRATKSTYHSSEGSGLYPCRSAGPYFPRSTKPTSQVFTHFWKTGITSLNPRDIAAATLVNPTFVYSLTGEGFALHYGAQDLPLILVQRAIVDGHGFTPHQYRAGFAKAAQARAFVTVIGGPTECVDVVLAWQDVQILL